MNTPLLFISTVLLWGTTWIAISAQVGLAPVTVSVFYRFALAAVLMLGGLWALGRLERPAVWRFVFLQALCLFCFNFIGLYNATLLLPSGLVSVIFSLASIFNVINARLFFGDPIRGRTVIGGALGALGLVCLFHNSLSFGSLSEVLTGVAWGAAGTMMFSLGNMASRCNTARGVTPLTANAWGMGIGALCLLAIVLLSGESLVLPVEPVYWGALAYLSIFASIVAFTTYLMLVARLGAARAGYTTVIFPVLALSLSAMFEGYDWGLMSVLGLALVAAGNIVIFRR